MDALTALADGLNLRARLAYAGGVCGKWLMDHNSDKSVWFHLISKGSGWAHSPAWTEPLALADGDLVMFLPHASRHYLSYDGRDLPRDPTAMSISDWEDGDSGLVCGEIELAQPQSPLWRALPAEIVIRRSEAGDILARLIELIVQESAAARFGSASVIERLCDGVFILILRHCIEADLVREGVFAAMKDRRLASVLGLIHGEPWTPWTLAELCERAGLSKTALSEKFAAQIGASPMEYLGNWRLQIAARWLRESALSIERVAERCGYDSAAAFGKAFKRCFGVAPGAYRKGNS